MKIKHLSFILFFLTLQGCSSVPATPTLERAVDFEKGVSNIPEDQFFFFEYRSRSDCSVECHCAAAEAPAPIYEITPDGELWIERELGFNLTGEPWLVTDAQGDQSLSGPIMGFFVMNEWGGQIHVVDALPFSAIPSDTTIATVYSVDADGTAIMEIFGETYYLKPGQSWTDSGEVQQGVPLGCHTSYSTSVTNYGLFSLSQLRFGFR